MAWTKKVWGFRTWWELFHELWNTPWNPWNDSPSRAWQPLGQKDNFTHLQHILRFMETMGWDIRDRNMTKWGFPEMGLPLKWTLYKGNPEIPIKNGWFGGTPISGNLQIDMFCITWHVYKAWDTEIMVGIPTSRGWKSWATVTLAKCNCIWGLCQCSSCLFTESSFINWIQLVYFSRFFSDKLTS